MPESLETNELTHDVISSEFACFTIRFLKRGTHLYLNCPRNGTVWFDIVVMCPKDADGITMLILIRLVMWKQSDLEQQVCSDLSVLRIFMAQIYAFSSIHTSK